MKSKLKILVLVLFPLITHAQFPPLDKDLSNYKYPHQVQYITISEQHRTIRLAYMDVDPGKQNSKAIVLMHGKNFSGAYWEDVITALSQNGFRVIIPDQAGFGKSSKDTLLQYSFHMMAHHTSILLDSLNIRTAIIAGHSMGGMLATRFALMYPDRTEKLILENPIGLEDYKLYVPYQTIEQWLESEMSQTPEKIKAYQQQNYYAGEWKEPYDRWLEIPNGWLKHPDYRTIAVISAKVYDMIYTQPVCYEFGNLSMPVLLITGTEDRTAIGRQYAGADSAKLGNYRELGPKTAAAIPQCTHIEIEATGHLPHIQAFDQFIHPVLKFLD